MDALTATQLKVFNQLSDVRDPSANLGTVINEIISNLPAETAPVNAVAATATLLISGVVIDGETVTIGADKYEFLADDEQTKTLPTNIAVDIHEYATKASQTLTVDTQPTSGDTMTIGNKVYTFVPVGTDTADGEISIGVDLAGAKLNIVAAINGTDEFNIAHPLVTCGDFDADIATITAIVGGTAGNAIATTETFDEGTNVFGAATLASGTNCSAANASSTLISTIGDLSTEEINATTPGSNSVTLTANNAGVAANAIALAETMANGAFAGSVTNLTGGVDGTIGVLGSMRIANSGGTDYLYVCIDQNTILDCNWRRLDLGSAF